MYEYGVLLYTRTVDSIEGTLRLGTQTLSTLSYSPLSNSVFAPENIEIVARINDQVTSVYLSISG